MATSDQVECREGPSDVGGREDRNSPYAAEQLDSLVSMSPKFTDEEESTGAESLASSPPPSAVKSMSPDARLQRIKYLVDQSKLYATFLTANLRENEPKDTRSHEVKQGQQVITGPNTSKAYVDEKPAKRRKKTQPRQTKTNQKTVDSFFKSMPPKVEQPPQPDLQQPAALQVQLHPHQHVGIQWMTSLYQNGLNGILADEMGLGKTLQVIGFLSYLMEQSITGPFLIVAPLSTIANWISEFERFAPSVGAAKYYGPRPSRAKLRRTLFMGQKTSVPVVVTSYEMVMSDAKFLGHIDWKYIIVDEGHRLKNVECRLMKELKKYKSANRMLLTGTPLQNNLTELWALLNFLLPDVFTDLELFHTWFESGEANLEQSAESNLVSSLHSILRPFLLRRLKSDVDLGLPAKREYVLFTGLTKPQTDLYQQVLYNNTRQYVRDRIEEEYGDTPQAKKQQEPATRRRSSYQTGDCAELSDNVERDESEYSDAAEEDTAKEESAETTDFVELASKELKRKSFKNMLMQLRLVCDSPYLFYYPWLNKSVDGRVVSSSGKMILLDNLVSRLKSTGHKVLIFSQFSRMLDLLEDWALLRTYSYFRIDGQTSQATRQELLQEFHAEADVDLFLLSTRSGGQGINLTAADTVIIFDSDWNPHQDLQAMDRVHRIGQTKPVLVFRLLTGDTVEQSLLEVAAEKLELGNLVIEKGKFKGIGMSQQEQIDIMDEQLQRHKMKFDGSLNFTESDFEHILDRSPQAYEVAKAQPNVNGNIYCR